MTLVILTAIRIVTELLRLAFVALDSFVTDLGERNEHGLRNAEAAERTWVRLPGSVLLGIVFVILALLSIFTVFLRQATTKLNDFVVGLAEGDGRITGTPSAAA